MVSWPRVHADPLTSYTLTKSCRLMDVFSGWKTVVLFLHTVRRQRANHIVLMKQNQWDDTEFETATFQIPGEWLTTEPGMLCYCRTNTDLYCTDHIVGVDERLATNIKIFDLSWYKWLSCLVIELIDSLSHTLVFRKYCLKLIAHLIAIHIQGVMVKKKSDILYLNISSSNLILWNLWCNRPAHMFQVYVVVIPICKIYQIVFFHP